MTVDEFKRLLNTALSAVQGDTPLFFGVIESNGIKSTVYCLDRIQLQVTCSGEAIDILVRELAKDADEDGGGNGY